MKTIKILSYVLFHVLIVTHISYSQESKLTNEIKKQIISDINSLLIENYIFEDVARNCTQRLDSNLINGIYDTINSKDQYFADILTNELQLISKDKHLKVVIPLVERSANNNEENLIIRGYKSKYSGEMENYGITRIEKLEDNVGYIELKSFSSLAVAKSFIDVAMSYLYTSDALLIDIRKNDGGSPYTVNYICSYFFEKPTHINSIYNHKRQTTTDFITFENVSGKKMSKVPIYVLVSNCTFSAGEEFAYDIQTRKRGIIIGELTRGGANPTGFFNLSHGLAIIIPTGRAINPITKTNWDGVGVIPDIKIDSDKAFEFAYTKARETVISSRKSLNEKVIEFSKELFSALDKYEILFSENQKDNIEGILYSVLEKGIRLNILSEGMINQLGYDQLNSNKIQTSVYLFNYNTKLFPESANAYDSLGEAYMKAGNNELAITNYEKSLELNPNNSNAEEILKQLKGN